MPTGHVNFTGSKLELVDGHKVLLNGIDISAIVRAKSIKVLNQGDVEPPQARLIIQPEEISIHMSRDHQTRTNRGAQQWDPTTA